MFSWLFSGRRSGKSRPARRRASVLATSSSALIAQRGLRYEPLEERAMFAIDTASDTPSFTLSRTEIVVQYGGGLQVIPGFAKNITPGADGSLGNLRFLVERPWSDGITMVWYPDGKRPTPFAVAPSIDPLTGDLTFALQPGARGTIRQSVQLIPGDASFWEMDLDAPIFTITTAPDWHNLDNPCDVDGDEAITGADLRLVSAALATQSGNLRQRDLNDKRFIDVNGDNVLSSIDVLLVVEKLNQQQGTAAPPLNTEELQVGHADAANNGLPLVGIDDAGGRVVVTMSNSAIVGQRYDAAGAKVGDAFTISGHDPWKSDVRLAMNGRGDFVVTWLEAGWIRARSYSSSGTTTDILYVGPQMRFENLSYSPVVGIDGQGNFTVVWAESSFIYSPTTLLMQRFSADGTSMGQIEEVAPLANDAPLVNYVPLVNDLPHPEYPDKWQTNPVIAMNEAGEFVVTWELRYSSVPLNGTDREIRARRFGADGKPVGDEFRVDSSPLEQVSAPRVDINAYGEFIVGWSTLPAFVGDDYVITPETVQMRFQRFDALGARLGGELELRPFALRLSSLPLVLDDQGNFVVAWAHDQNLYFRRFDWTSDSWGAVERVNAHDGEAWRNTAFEGLAANGRGQFVFAWQETDYELTQFPEPQEPYIPQLVVPVFQVRMKAYEGLPLDRNSIELNEDETISRNIAEGLLGAAAVAAGTKVDLVANTSHGRLELIGDGSFSYAPAKDYFGEDSFSYVVVDGNQRSAPLKIRLRIKPVNDAPVVETSQEVIKIPVGAGPQRIEGWLKEISPGPTNEAGQGYSMLVSWGSPVSEAQVDATSGDLTFEILPSRAGVFTVGVTVIDGAGLSTTKSLTIVVGTAWQNEYNEFDVDNNGKIDGSDMSALNQAIATLGEGPLPDLRPDNALWLDVDGDGSLTAGDRKLLQRYFDGEIVFLW